MDFEPQKVFVNPFFAGLAGALLGLKFAPGIGWLERASNVFAGSICAAYVAPAAGESFHLTSSSMMGFLAFFIGMFGMSIAAAVFQGVRETKFGEIITGWLQRK